MLDDTVYTEISCSVPAVPKIVGGEVSGDQAVPL